MEERGDAAGEERGLDGRLARAVRADHREVEPAAVRAAHGQQLRRDELVDGRLDRGGGVGQAVHLVGVGGGEREDRQDPPQLGARSAHLARHRAERLVASCLGRAHYPSAISALVGPAGSTHIP